MGRPKKPGRKPVPRDVKRGVRLVVLVTPGEREALEAKARAAGRPLTTYMREALLNGNGTGARLADLEERVAALEGTTAPADLRQEILTAWKGLGAGGSGYVKIPALRRALPGVAREAFDAALYALQAEGTVTLNKLNDPRDWSAEDLDACILNPTRGRLGFVSQGDGRGKGRS